MAEFRADIECSGDQRRPLRRIWRYVGYDEPNYTYTQQGRELLEKLAGMSEGFFVRCHFLLCTGDGTPSLKWGSTNVYTIVDGVPHYDWTIIDCIFDTWVELGHVPFVEIGFTPEAMTSAPANVTYASSALGSGWSYPPRDYEAWGRLVGELVEHCVARYGLREVVRWRWELWNEPDIPYFTGTVTQYCELYDHTEYAIHSRYPGLQVGGPSTTNPGSEKAARFLTEFLDHCSVGMNRVSGREGTRLDFITFHAKGAHLTREPGAPKQTPTIRTLVDHVRDGLEIVRRYPSLADREIVVSECDPDGWAAGTRRDNPNLEYRNNEYYASYLGATIGELLALASDADVGSEASRAPRVDGALTWAFEFEGRELFEGMRSLSTNGIDKPVLNTLRLFERLGPFVLPGKADLTGTTDPAHTVRCIATIREDGRLAVLVVSHHDDWDVSGSPDVALRLRSLADATYRMTTYRVDAKHGNAYAAWIEMGRPAPGDTDAAERLRDASRLRPERTIVAPTNGETTIRMTVNLRSVTLVELEPERS